MEGRASIALKMAYDLRHDLGREPYVCFALKQGQPVVLGGVVVNDGIALDLRVPAEPIPDQIAALRLRRRVVQRVYKLKAALPSQFKGLGIATPRRGQDDRCAGALSELA